MAMTNLRDGAFIHPREFPDRGRFLSPGQQFKAIFTDTNERWILR